MSGGYFGYSEDSLKYIVERLEAVLENREERGISDKVAGEIAATIINLNVVYACVHRIDYLLSGDDSEESFNKRLDEDLRALGH